MLGMADEKEPTINVKYVDDCYVNMSKALNIFAQRYNLKFEEIDIIVGRMSAEFRQKQMDMYVRYVMEEVMGILGKPGEKPKPPKVGVYG